MLESGYSAPESAISAQKLTQLLTQEFINILNQQKLDINEESDETDWIDATWNSCINHCVGKINNFYSDINK